jgi:Outer membrane protein beta-barrel domain
MKKITFYLISLCAVGAPAFAQSSHFTGFVGGGFTTPINPIGSRLDNGYNITAGAGVNANNHLGIMLDFIYNANGINRTFLNQVQAPDGQMRVWGFTLDPVVHLSKEGPVDFYVTGGGGIYHRTVEYTQPVIAQGVFFDPWWGFYPASFGATQVIGSYGQYKGGVDGGLGLSFKVGGGNLKAFAEARYHHIFTRGVETGILPVTFGVRW